MLTRKQKWRKCPSYSIQKKIEKSNMLDDKVRSYEQIHKENSIKFSNLVKVVLIPSRIEYEKVDLDKKLWYKDDDYLRFQNDYFKEIKKSKYSTL